MNFSSSERNTFFAIKNILKFSKVKVNDEALKKVLIEHPEFPSLACYEDVFNTFNIKSIPAKININLITELELPLLAHIEDFDGAYFIVVTKIRNGIVTYYLDKNRITETFYHFLKKWHGIVCVIYIDKDSKEVNFFRNKFLRGIFNFLNLKKI